MTKLVLGKSNQPTFDSIFGSMFNMFDASPFSNSMLSVRDSLKKFDRLENSIFVNEKYPPYNLIEEIDGNSYTLEFAVAGFEKEELEISLESDVLTVKGQSKNSESFNHKGEDSSPALRRILHQGLARRAFTNTFSLPENSIVEDVSLKNGILLIKIIKVVPEERKKKLLEIK